MRGQMILIRILVVHMPPIFVMEVIKQLRQCLLQILENDNFNKLSKIDAFGYGFPAMISV